ncbi:MAG: OmpA family protein [Bacteroidaceae bacterium]|nr:OmpA family protein [Bacteroidaceae bacterium]
MKKYLLFIIVAVMGLSTNAQVLDSDEGIVNVVKTSNGNGDEIEISYYDSLLVRTNSFLSNWELLTTIGGQFSVGEDDPSAQFWDWWTFPVVDFRVYKWVNPIFGAGVGMSYIRWKAVYGESTLPIETFGWPDDREVWCDGDVFGLGTSLQNTYAKQSRGHYMDIFLVGMSDLCNLFGGYKPDRRFHLLATFGGGLAFTMGAKHNKMSPSFNLGLHAEYDITQRWSLTVGLRGMFLSDSFCGQFYETNKLRDSPDPGNLKMDGAFGATVGVAYSFGFQKTKNKYRKWVPMTRVVQTSADSTQVVNNVKIDGITNEEVDVAAADIAAGVDVKPLIASPVTYERAEKKAPEMISYVPAKKVVKEYVDNYKVLVNFVIDRWEISNREEIIIQHAAEYINSAPAGQKFDVMGYADVQTATPDHNEMLSRNRANNVAKMLVEKYKVDPSRLNITWVGGHDYLYFEDPQCTRSVIIRAVGSDSMVKK